MGIFHIPFEVLEFEFVIGAGQRELISCEVERPFKLRMYEIDREVSQAHSIWFDNKEMKRLNAQKHFILLDEPYILKKEFSLISSNMKAPYPDKVIVRLIGEFVE